MAVAALAVAFDVVAYLRMPATRLGGAAAMNMHH
jgi:hypothetical protein